jgi:uncharacterized delta-60 repeat protein
MSFIGRAAAFVKNWSPAISPSGSRRAAATQRRPSAAKFRFESLEGRRMFAAGALDTTFSDDGYATFTNSGNPTDGRAVAVQSDGKIVVAGTDKYGAADGAAYIARLTPNGTLDPTFSGDGIQIVHFGTNREDDATDIVIQPDGKILVAGYTELNDSADFFVVRLTTTGVLDSSFSGDGQAQINVRKFDWEPQIALQSDGKIVLAGTTTITPSGRFMSTEDVALVRLKSNGDVDTSFSGDGKLAVDTSGVGKRDEVSSLTIAPNGKYIVGGSTIASISEDWQINWFHPSGKLYRTKRITFGGDDHLNDLVMDSSGVITAVGYSSRGGPYKTAIARISSTGFYDKSFDGDSNGNGRIALSFADPPGGIGGDAISLVPGGKIMLGGTGDFHGSAHMGLIKLNANGSLDKSFSGNGYEIYPFPTTTPGVDSDEFMSKIVIAGGKLVAVGRTSSSVEDRLAVMRVLM